jgi:hypothetical protein
MTLSSLVSDQAKLTEFIEKLHNAPSEETVPLLKIAVLEILEDRHSARVEQIADFQKRIELLTGEPA